MDVNEPQEVKQFLANRDVKDQYGNVIDTRTTDIAGDLYEIQIRIMHDEEYERVYDYLAVDELILDGDTMIYCVPLMGIERKSIWDFYSSLMDNSLLEQANKMVKNAIVNYLLIEGPLDQIYFEHPDQMDFMMSTFCTIREAYGISVLWTLDHETTAMQIRHAYKKIGANPIMFLDKKAAKKVPPQVRALTQVPGWGETLVRQLFKFCPSVRFAANLPEDIFVSLDKVGKKKAANMWHFFNDPVKLDAK